MASEADTRANYIDPALRAADWQPSNIIREHYFTDGRKMAEGRADDAASWITLQRQPISGGSRGQEGVRVSDKRPTTGHRLCGKTSRSFCLF